MSTSGLCDASELIVNATAIYAAGVSCLVQLLAFLAPYFSCKWRKPGIFARCLGSRLQLMHRIRCLFSGPARGEQPLRQTSRPHETRTRLRAWWLVSLIVSQGVLNNITQTKTHRFDSCDADGLDENVSECQARWCSTEHQTGRDSSDGDSLRIYVIVLSDHVEPNESERPVPKSIVVEQGMHPHPGPGGDVTAAEAFE